MSRAEHTTSEPATLYVQFVDDDCGIGEVKVYTSGDQFQDWYPFVSRGTEYHCEGCGCHLINFWSREDLPLMWREKDGFKPFTIDEDDSGTTVCLSCFLTSQWAALYRSEELVAELAAGSTGRHARGCEPQKQLEVVRAGDLTIGDMVMPEEYDEHCAVTDYDVDAAELRVESIVKDGDYVKVRCVWPSGQYNGSVGDSPMLHVDSKALRLKR